MCSNMTKPKLVLLVSGKRKGGKDYLTALLLPRIGVELAEIVRISEPIKSHWANEKGLDLSLLLSDNPYKEIYRREMIEWSDSVRARDPGYFCREAMNKAEKPVVIVSDIRRKTDIKFFQEENYNIRTIRIEVSDETRTERGWKFQTGVDDVQSECDLDNYDGWDIQIANDGSDDIQQFLIKLTEIVREEIAQNT